MDSYGWCHRVEPSGWEYPFSSSGLDLYGGHACWPMGLATQSRYFGLVHPKGNDAVFGESLKGYR